MVAAAPTTARVPLATMHLAGIPDGMGGLTRTASCKVGGTSILPFDTVEFSFEWKQEERTCVLHTTALKKDDPYGQCPTKYDTDVICIHRNLVLLRLRGTGIRSPTVFFVYSFAFSREEHDTVVMVPPAAPEICSSQSFVLLRHKKDSKNYVVANLQTLFLRNEAILHSWFSTSPSWSKPVKIDLSHHKLDLMSWQTHQVIPSFGTLLWVDLNQGILRCSDTFNTSNVDFIPAPAGRPRLPSRQARLLMCVGCGRGLKFVYLNISDANIVWVSILIWSRSKYKWQPLINTDLNCTDLWNDVMKMLPQIPKKLWCESDNHMPCLPVLKDDTLFLTIANKDTKHAWLLQLQLDTKSKYNVVSATACPDFFIHQKPPCLIDSSDMLP